MTQELSTDSRITLVSAFNDKCHKNIDIFVEEFDKVFATPEIDEGTN